MEAWISVAFGAFSLAEVEPALRFVAQGPPLEAEAETGSEAGVEAEVEVEAATETGIEAEAEVEFEVEVGAGAGAGSEEVYEVPLCVLVYCYSPRLT